MIERKRLLDLLLGSGASVVTVVAPPGYGKTTLLTQLAERLAPRVAWVSCEEVETDPVAMWAAVIAALQPLAPSSWSAPSVLAQSGGHLPAVPRLVASFSQIQGRVLLVLDNAESIRTRECWAALTELALRLPGGWRIVFGAREELPIPLSRIRLQHQVLELGAGELAMTPHEAEGLLTRCGSAGHHDAGCGARRPDRGLGRRSVPGGRRDE